MSAHGPNVAKLIMRFIARMAIPEGGGLLDALKFFQNQEHRKRIMEKAEREALNAIQLIKAAPDNPFGNNDEEIALALLKKIEEAKK